MYEVMSYRTDQGVKTVIVGKPGRKYLPVLMIEASGVTVRKVPLTEQRYMTDVIGGSKPIKSVLRQIGSAGRTLGMTKAAKSFLREARRAVN